MVEPELKRVCKLLILQGRAFCHTLKSAQHIEFKLVSAGQQGLIGYLLTLAGTEEWTQIYTEIVYQRAK